MPIIEYRLIIKPPVFYVLAGLLILWIFLPKRNHFNNKINGITIEGPRRFIDKKTFSSVIELDGNWIALNPYSYKAKDSNKLVWETEGFWWGENKMGIKTCMEYARANDMMIMIKPHIWNHHGTYTGEIDFDLSKDWEAFETSYKNYILEYVKLADMYSVELFCIGTELDQFIRERPKFWIGLIDSIHEISDMKLVYAANWDAYREVHFWEKLDYIGINAYFPLSDSKTPKKEELLSGWDRYFYSIQELSNSMDKRIIFTEYGYRSVDYAAKEPWNSEGDVNVNLQAQYNCYEAIYEKFWLEDWLAGGFLWKWQFGDEDKSENYSPQGKLGMKMIRQGYQLN